MFRKTLTLPFQNLRAKALSLTMFLVAGAVVGANVLSLVSTNRLIESDQRRSVELLASALGAAAELPIAVGDRDEVARIADRFVELHPGLLFITVDAETLTVPVSAARDTAALGSHLRGELDPKHATVFESTTVMSAGEDGDLFGLDPTLDAAPEPDRETIRIVVASSTDIIAAAQQAQLRDSIASAALIAAISMPLAYVAISTIVRRLGVLAQAAEQISNGEFDRPLSDSATDEIGRLVGAFDRMRIAVRERDERERLRQSELKEARDAAQFANSAKSQFLAHMSHEIRTPLNGVIGMLDLLELTHVDQKQSRYMDIARSSADSLLGLINDILDFSKIEAGQIEIERIEFGIRDVFETAAEMIAPKASAKGIELLCHVAPDVPDCGIGDPNKLRQIVINLTNNAVKFTETGEIIIRVSRLHEDEGGVVYRASVTDTGIGIPPDRRDRLFKPFSQVDASTTRRFGGTGLGLAICKSFAELMDGEIGIDQERESGSEFWFTFRLGRSGSTASRGPEGIESLAGVRTLIIDDNATNREILREALGRWGAEVSEVDGGPPALLELRNASKDAPVQLVILDMQMPDMDGVQVADAIGSDPSIEKPCIVMLTSMHHTAQTSDLANLGITACLQKPAKLSVLFETLRDALGGSRLTLKSPVGGNWKKGSFEGLRLLVAEDNEVNQIVVRELLGTAGIRCDIAPNGRAAVDAFDPEKHRAVLMDCEMPVMDGFEATRALREKPGGEEIPIIALTANAIRGDRERCLAAGMTEYVTKPIEPSELFGTLEQLLGHDHETTPPAPVSNPVAQGDNEPVRLIGMNMDAALERCGGSGQVLLLALEAFERQARATLADLENASRDADHARLASIAHAMKGAAANLGIGLLSDRAAAVEHAAGESAVAEITSGVEALRSDTDRFLGQLPELRSRVEEMA